MTPKKTLFYMLGVKKMRYDISARKKKHTHTQIYNK